MALIPEGLFNNIYQDKDWTRIKEGIIYTSTHLPVTFTIYVKGNIAGWEDESNRRSSIYNWRVYDREIIHTAQSWLTITDEPPDDTALPMDEWNAKVDALLKECGAEVRGKEEQYSHRFDFSCLSHTVIRLRDQWQTVPYGQTISIAGQAFSYHGMVEYNEIVTLFCLSETDTNAAIDDPPEGLLYLTIQPTGSVRSQGYAFIDAQAEHEARL